MKKTILTLGLSALVIGGCLLNTSCSSGEYDPLADGVLTIGLECAYNPFNYTEYASTEYNAPIKGTNGEYAAGYDILIAKKLCEDLGVRLEVVRCEWDGLIPSLQSKTIDVVIAGMTATPQRRNSIDFTDAYYSSQLVIVTKDTEEIRNYTKIEDFAGMKFMAQVGTVQADLIDDLGDSKSESYAGIVACTHSNTYPEAFIALTAGTVDAVVCETPVANDFISLHNGYRYTVLEGNDDFVVSVNIGVSKKAVSSYLEKLNASLGKISQSEREAMMTQITTR